MYYIYDKTIAQSILENLYAKKYVKQNGKLYEFYICNNILILNVYNDKSPLLYKTYQVEKNVKGEFAICEDEQNSIHIIVANKKYDLIYIQFDGNTFQKETVCYFNNNVGIPTTPVLHVKNNLICIALEFITFGTKKEWTLRCYIKRNDSWENFFIDKGIGLCYIQPDFILDAQDKIHLIYREFKEKSYIKYILFDIQKPQLEKAKIILDNENDKYCPHVFMKESNKIFFCWLETTDTGVNLCCTNTPTNSNQNIFKIDISENITEASIHFKGSHIYCVFADEDSFYYDMCCEKKLTQSWVPNLSLQEIYTK